MTLFWFIAIGITSGWISGKLMRGHSFGVVGNLVVGTIGSIIGGFMSFIIGLQGFGLVGNLFTATVGSIVLLWAIKRLRQRNSDY